MGCLSQKVDKWTKLYNRLLNYVACIWCYEGMVNTYRYIFFYFSINTSKLTKWKLGRIFGPKHYYCFFKSYSFLHCRSSGFLIRFSGFSLRTQLISKCLAKPNLVFADKLTFVVTIWIPDESMIQVVITISRIQPWWLSGIMNSKFK